MLCAQKMRSLANLASAIIAILSISACSQEATMTVSDTSSDQTSISSEDVRTYEELRSFLDQEYEGVEELPITAIIESGTDTRVPFSFRLQDGREFKVPVVFTRNNERIVDPMFDLNSLPARTP